MEERNIEGSDLRAHLHTSVETGNVAVGDVIPLVLESSTDYFVSRYENVSGEVVSITTDLFECTVVGKPLSEGMHIPVKGDIVTVPRHYQTSIAEQIPTGDNLDGVAITVDRREQEYRAHAEIAGDDEFRSR